MRQSYQSDETVFALGRSPGVNERALLVAGLDRARVVEWEGRTKNEDGAGCPARDRNSKVHAAANAGWMLLLLADLRLESGDLCARNPATLKFDVKLYPKLRESAFPGS